MKIYIFCIIVALFHQCNPYIELTENPEKLCNEYVTADRIKHQGIFIGMSKKEFEEKTNIQVTKEAVALNRDVGILFSDETVDSILINNLSESEDFRVFDLETVTDFCGIGFKKIPLYLDHFSLTYSSKGYSFYFKPDYIKNDYPYSLNINKLDQIQFFSLSWFQRNKILFLEKLEDWKNSFFRCHNLFSFNICRYSKLNDLIYNPKQICSYDIYLRDITVEGVFLDKIFSRLNEQKFDERSVEKEFGLIFKDLEYTFFEDGNLKEIFLPASVLKDKSMFRSIPFMKRACGLPEKARVTQTFDFYYRDRFIKFEWKLPEKKDDPFVFLGIRISIVKMLKED